MMLSDEVIFLSDQALQNHIIVCLGHAYGLVEDLPQRVPPLHPQSLALGRHYYVVVGHACFM